MNKRFKEYNPDWINPKKFIIGESKFIENAIVYEKENDARIDELENRESTSDSETTVSITSNLEVDETSGNIAPPIKFEIQDRTDDDDSSTFEIVDGKKIFHWHFSSEKTSIASASEIIL